MVCHPRFSAGPVLCAGFAALLALGAAVPATSTVSVPDTPAGRRFMELMALADTEDEPRTAAYVQSQFTEGMRRTAPGDPGVLPFLMDHARRFQGFRLERVVASAPDHLTMLVRPHAQPVRWLRYVLKVESAPPHRIEGLFLMPAAPDEIPAEGGRIDPAAAVRAFGGDVDRLLSTSEFSGVILLARGGEIVFQRAAGEADRDHHVPIQPDTRFGIASMNKMFTAVAIGRLVERGRIAWDDPVEKHLKGWLTDDLAAQVTIHQLLTHTSGLGDYLDRIATDPGIRNARSLSAYRDLVRAARIEGKPEDGVHYSNLGYVVLGAIIEAVSGGDYFEFVRDEVYAPAGMTRSGSWSADEAVEGRAIGYLRPGEAESRGLGPGVHSNLLLKGARGTSAGGGLSTAGDLLRFARALVEGRLVRPQTLATMLRPHVRFPVGGDYGYGFVVHTDQQGRKVFGHAGGFPGVNGELKIYGDGAWTLVVLSNFSEGAGGIVGAWDGIAVRLAP